MSKNVYFVTSNKQYDIYATMCVNSLIKNTNTDIIWLQINYINQSITSNRLRYINVDMNQYQYVYKDKRYDSNRMSKSIRFIELDKIINSGQYDNICLMDADMVVISDKFDQLFQLVDGNSNIVGINENFKWIINNNYTINGKPIFDHIVYLTKFTCSVPLFFNVDTMNGFVDTYFDVFLNGKMNYQNRVHDIGDMFAYNIAIKKLHKEDDVIMLPAQMFTQTHMDGYLPWNSIRRNCEQKLVTKQGLEVYSLHGRLIEQGYRSMIQRQVVKLMQQYKIPQTQIQKYKNQLHSIMRLVRQEFQKYGK